MAGCAGGAAPLDENRPSSSTKNVDAWDISCTVHVHSALELRLCCLILGPSFCRPMACVYLPANRSSGLPPSPLQIRVCPPETSSPTKPHIFYVGSHLSCFWLPVMPWACLSWLAPIVSLKSTRPSCESCLMTQTLVFLAVRALTCDSWMQPLAGVTSFMLTTCSSTGGMVAPDPWLPTWVKPPMVCSLMLAKFCSVRP